MEQLTAVADQIKTVAVVGLGYVGLPLALLIEQKGYRVIGIDTDPVKLAKLRRHEAPFADAYIAQHIAGSAMEAVDDFSRVREAFAIIICVPTPVHEDHVPDLEPLKAATRGIAPYLTRGQLVVVESTVNPGVCETVVLPILEKLSGLTAGADFYLSHCPERINPGDATWTAENTPRVVGSLEQVGLGKTVALYGAILTGAVKPMGSLKEAEAVKMVENAFRDINIAFVNELARSFWCLDIDVVNVIEGASSKPFSFMPHFPGCGVGGHCIPVDPYYLIQYARHNGFEHKFLALARKINNDMPAFTVQLLAEALKKRSQSVKGSMVTVLGLAYKANIDDCRESPATAIIKHLLRKGATVATYDPFVPQKSSAKNLRSALEGSSAVIVATGHDMFLEKCTPDFFETCGIYDVIDGRNCLNKDAFAASSVQYVGIGRKAAGDKKAAPVMAHTREERSAAVHAMAALAPIN